MLDRVIALTPLSMTARNLYRRPMRTSLTALGVGVGVVAIVAFSSIVRGLWGSTDAAIHFNDASLLVFEAGIAADILSSLDEDDTRRKLAEIPEVTFSLASLWYLLPIERQPFCLAMGLRIEDMERRREHLIAGDYIASDDEVLLGSILSGLLDKDVGETVSIRSEPYRVAGIFHTDVVFYNGAIIISLPRLQRLASKVGRVTTFQVSLREDADPHEVAAQMEERFPELAVVADVSEYHKVDQGLVMANSMIWAVSFVALVVGSLIVTNTMWMSVLERTQEIGVLRAVGWSKGGIVGLIVLESMGVGLLGFMIGCLLGVGLAELTAMLPVTEQFLDPQYGAGLFLLAGVIAVALSAVGAVLPAWRAVRISPAEALRYE
ncbi:MAG: ABC transporter permease [Planctomycetes bacterium]|nr:ABC transporter permease [Planctomycetota bacterium]